MAFTSLPVSICLIVLAASIQQSITQSIPDETEPACANENSYLWKVNSQPPVYLFGTMHVPYTKLWEHIPENAKIAFVSSQDLRLELRLTDKDTVNDLRRCQQLPSKNVIEDVLSSNIIERIKTYLERIHLLLPEWLGMQGSSLFGRRLTSDALYNAIASEWSKKRPIWVLLMLSSLTEENIKSRNIPLLDLFLENAADGLGKRVQAMETAGIQCRPLNKLSNQHVELALEVKLDHLEYLLEKNQKIESSLEQDIETYRCGNFEELISTTPLLPLPPLENITEMSRQLSSSEITILHAMEGYLWKHMVTRRNKRMADTIATVLSQDRNRTYFFALGAGHYLSKNNVVDRLRRKGFSVDHITAQTSIDGPELPSNIIQLGDPSSRVMAIPTVSENPRPYIPTLSPDSLAEIWRKHLIPHTFPLLETTPTPEADNQTQVNSIGHRSKREIKVEQTREFNPESNSQAYSNSLPSIYRAPYNINILLLGLLWTSVCWFQIAH